MKITAVVVTYNRLDLLKECIQSLREQTRPLDEIVVVNNSSTDGTDLWLKTQAGLTVIRQDNLGGSGGQYTGMRVAVEHEADWIWSMDDDAAPYPDALGQLMPYTGPDPRGPIAALSTAVIENSGKISYIHRGFFNYKRIARDFGCTPAAAGEYTKPVVEIGYATFVGILVNARAIATIGLPKKEMFIHFDDIEYSLRLKQYGRILLVPSSRILHKENASNHFYFKRVFGKDRVRIRFDKLWARYYGIRNLSWGVKEYYGKKWDTPLVLAWYFVRSAGGILLFDDHKLKRIAFLRAAMRDGLSSRFENGYDYINHKTKLY